MNWNFQTCFCFLKYLLFLKQTLQKTQKVEEDVVRNTSKIIDQYALIYVIQLRKGIN